MSEMVAKNNDMPGNSGKSENNVETKELDGSETSAKDASAMTTTIPAAVDADEATAKNLMATDTATSPKVENKKPSTKRTPSKRLSFIERAQRESEELVKNLGGSLELEGGRRTRSSTRGTPARSAVVATPPPVKKARASPATSVTPTTPRRGRGRKIDISKEPVEKKLTLDESKTIADTAEEETTNNEEVNDSKNASIEKSGDNSIENVPNKTVSPELPEKMEEITSISDEEDKTDATPLEVIPEESQNNVDHCSESTEDRSGCNASAQNVPEVSKSLNISEGVASPTQKENVEMEPLPEPMETDSTICSNTIEPHPTTAESVESDGKISINSIGTSSVEDPVTVQNSSDAQISKETSTTEVHEIIKDAEPVTTVSEIVQEEKIDESSGANDTQEVEADNDSVEIAAAGEPQATTKQTSVQITEDTMKSGNDLCEPKIVSPATTDEAVTATPQFCN